ncbi:MAG: nitrous oxide reductase accessory protein NosL [Bryobacteraceae bacterium]|jgi:nitrous oxide reductase accessory protein NosL
MRLACAAILLALCAAPWVDLAADGVPFSVPPPRAMDLCPVCGMIVSKYPNWIATVVWKDGHAHHFDGAKDMFKFLQALPKYAPGHKRDDIRFIAVTDFYNLEKIEAGKASYVIGSDVMGPMGPELVPLATRADAEDFFKDHKGKLILGFGAVTPEIVAKVDSGKF